MHSDMTPGTVSFQSAKEEKPILVKVIEIAGFAAIAAVGTGLGEIFQRKLSDTMGRKVNVKDYIPEEKEAPRREPARRSSADAMERYRF